MVLLISPRGQHRFLLVHPRLVRVVPGWFQGAQVQVSLQIKDNLRPLGPYLPPRCCNSSHQLSGPVQFQPRLLDRNYHHLLNSHPQLSLPPRGESVLNLHHAVIEDTRGQEVYPQWSPGHHQNCRSPLRSNPQSLHHRLPALGLRNLP